MRKVYVEQTEDNVKIACITDNEVERYIVLDAGSPVGSIYRGKVVRIISAGAFVDIGREKDGFLKKRDKLNVGDYVTVMVEREENGDKGCLLTENVSLSGRYSVVESTDQLSFARKISAEKKQLLTEYFAGKGILFRTACEDADVTDIEREVERNSFALNTIVDSGKNLYRVEELYHYDPINIAHELSVDDEIIYSFDEIRPFIDDLEKRKIECGEAELVFDRTEAMTVIDVNSHVQKERFSDPSDMAFYVDSVAAKEAARQIKLRNIAGLIAIDFINVYDADKIKKLESILSAELKKDFVKTEVEFAPKTCVALITRTNRYGK